MVRRGFQPDPFEKHAASEAYSVASSSLIDTCSEPPRCDGKFAEKIMKRACRGKVMSKYDVALDGSLLSSKMVSSKSVTSPTASSKPATSFKTSSSKQQGSGSKSVRDASSVTSSRSSRVTYYDGSGCSGPSRKTNKDSSGTNSRGASGSGGTSRHTAGRSTKRSSVLDPESSSNLALVPMKQQSPALDPPTYCSTSGSSGTSSEESAALYDPPGFEKRNQQMTMWRELEEEDVEKEAILDTIQSASESEESESDYEESGSRSSSSEGGEDFVEETALALRERGGEMVVATSEGDAVDSRALVKFEDSSSSSRSYQEDAIVQASSRYLASAVDNNFAMVPINSSVYEAYDHTFVTCPEDLRFRVLYTFLK